MKTKFVVLAAAIAAIGMGSQAVRAQYPMSPYAGMQPGMMNPGMYQTVSNNMATGGGHLDDEIITDNESCKAGGKGGKGGAGCGDPCRTVDFYGDFLYLRARDSEVAWATEIDGNIGQYPVQISPIAIVDMDFQPAFRAGARAHVDECSAVSAQYTFYDGSTSDAIARTGTDVIRSIVQHPGALNVARDWVSGTAQYDINFDLIDASYQSLFYCDDCTEVSYLVGFRYVQHEQVFDANFAGNGTETVSTDIDFYGAGVRFGFEADRYLTCRWALYARGYGSLIPGEFKADYDQRQSFNETEVDTAWKAGRIVSIWDLEIGTSLVSKCGWYRLDVGYVFSAWTNMVQTDEWIQGVRRNDFIDMDSTSTFDGLMARAEIRY